MPHDESEFVESPGGWMDIDFKITVNARGGWSMASLAEAMRAYPGEAVHEVTVHARVPIPAGRKWDVDATIRKNRGTDGRTPLSDVDEEHEEP